MLLIVVGSAVVLAVAYRVYGRILSRLLELDDTRPTPAVEMRDDVDYVPIEPKYLMGQHFSAIAAAGPIVGPILAGVYFGWLPALLWILIGSIFIGGVHDMTTLFASVRHKARSMAEVVKQHMTRRSYLLFLAFVWIALVYILVAFTDVTANSFVGVLTLDNGEEVTGGGIATSSLLYLALPIIMACFLRYTKMSLGVATVIFLPLVGLSIWGGQLIPFDLAQVLDVPDAQAHRVWDVLLLVYCFIASIVPMWLLLQPRGHLGGYFLYVALGGAALGLIFGGHEIKYPSFIGWESAANNFPLFPVLFITIACGACSGFHSIISSGTTSKQLKRESDARSIGYGAMLLEAMVAVVSLACVMILARDSELISASPNFLYAKGIGSFVTVMGISEKLGISFGLMAFTTFVYDTLDVCTRLGRYIIQELTGWQGAKGRWFGTAVTAGAPLLFLLGQPSGGVPAWKEFWGLFGASNQLLAALSLMGVTVWLWRTRRETWVWFVTGIPTVFMYVMSMWALGLNIQAKWASVGADMPWAVGLNLAVTLMLVGLALLMAVEAVRVVASLGGSPPPEPDAVPA
ncbi:MAG: carbon starvation protein A [Planctomycetales bacterium]|nr:carbon starvation protein A [Planctomycetales bacterium]